MKKLLVFIICSALPISLWAQSGLKPDQMWVEQADGGRSIPLSSDPQDSNPGFGGDLNIGYRLDRTLAFFVGTGYYQYDLPASPAAAKGKLAYVPFTGICRLTWGDGPLRPYLFGALGIALSTYSQANLLEDTETNKAETDFYAAPGLGVLFALSSNMAFFLQSRVDLVFTSHNGLGIPLDSPTVFIPLQAGISFFAL